MKKKKNEKRQVRVDVLDGVWAALWCRESPNLCPGSLSVTNPADAHGWCFRSQAHITQRTGAAGPCLALLWQFSTLITSTSKNQAKGRIQGTILPCFASSQHRHLKGWAGGNQTTAHHLSCVPGEWLLSFQHKLGTQKLWMSSWTECLPCVQAACFQRAPRKYQFSVLLGRCRCSTESWGQGRFQPSRRIPELSTEILLPAALSGSTAWPGFDWHQSPRASLSVFITCFVPLKACVFSAAAELPELGLDN